MVTNELTNKQWFVIRIWECEIKAGASEQLQIIKKRIAEVGK